jgi:hypothetical protein
MDRKFEKDANAIVSLRIVICGFRPPSLAVSQKKLIVFGKYI